MKIKYLFLLLCFVLFSIIGMISASFSPAFGLSLNCEDNPGPTLYANGQVAFCCGRLNDDSECSVVKAPYMPDPGYFAPTDPNHPQSCPQNDPTGHTVYCSYAPPAPTQPPTANVDCNAVNGYCSFSSSCINNLHFDNSFSCSTGTCCVPNGVANPPTCDQINGAQCSVIGSFGSTCPTGKHVDTRFSCSPNEPPTCCVPDAVPPPPTQAPPGPTLMPGATLCQQYGGTCYPMPQGCGAAPANTCHMTALDASCTVPPDTSPYQCCGPQSDPYGQCSAPTNTPQPPQPTYPGEPSSPPPPCLTLSPNGQCLSVDTGLGVISTDPSGFVSSIFSILLSVSGAIAILIIMYAGYRLIASQGDPEKIQQARELLTAAIVGLFFLIFSFVILSVIGVDLLHLPGFSG